MIFLEQFKNLNENKFHLYKNLFLPNFLKIGWVFSGGFLFLKRGFGIN